MKNGGEDGHVSDFFDIVYFSANVELADFEKKNVLKEFLTRKGCSILHQNVRGLLNNFTTVEELISSNQNIDVLTLSETHITAE